MYLKIHKVSGSAVVAVADEDLLGKTLEDENYSVKVSEHFYKGEKKEAATIISILKTATNINLIGEEAVAIGVKAGVIERERIIMIAGVPHAQVYVS